MSGFITPNIEAKQLPYNTYLLLYGPGVGLGGNDLSIGVRVLPDQFLDAGCTMFCHATRPTGSSISEQPTETWRPATERPEPDTWCIGKCQLPADEVNVVCPYDVYHYHGGQWWNEDGTELSVAPLQWLPIVLPTSEKANA